MYNTADSLIVGNFLGSNALAAVSSSGNLIFLMVGFINGIAMGAGVVIARYYGAKNREDLQKAIHTTVAFGLAAGVALTVLGMYLAPKMLVLMGQGLVAYLPAAGQFMNEGANGSGWGGPFTATGSQKLKGLVEGYVTTGVSLGAFGGYVVLDFGVPAKDEDGNVSSKSTRNKCS